MIRAIIRHSNITDERVPDCVFLYIKGVLCRRILSISIYHLNGSGYFVLKMNMFVFIASVKLASNIKYIPEEMMASASPITLYKGYSVMLLNIYINLRTQDAKIQIAIHNLYVNSKSIFPPMYLPG